MPEVEDIRRVPGTDPPAVGAHDDGKSTLSASMAAQHFHLRDVKCQCRKDRNELLFREFRHQSEMTALLGKALGLDKDPVEVMEEVKGEALNDEQPWPTNGNANLGHRLSDGFFRLSRLS